MREDIWENIMAEKGWDVMLEAESKPKANPKAKAMTEKQFGMWLEALCKLTSHLYYHTFNSRYSAPGFPDYTIVHPRTGRLIFAELKSETGRLRVEQERWLRALSKTNAEVYLWRPSDRDAIEALLMDNPRDGRGYAEKPEGNVQGIRRRK